MYETYDHEATLAALNRRLSWAKERFVDVFPASLPALEELSDLARLPVSDKEHCVPERIDLRASNGYEVMLASGGSGGRPAFTLQSRDEFLLEGQLFADALQSYLPEGAGKWMFVNTVASGGLWGGGYFFFVTSMSHARFVGANVCGRPPEEMITVLRRALDHGTGGQLEGIIVVGLPPVLTEMASAVHDLTEALALQVRFVFVGHALERQQAAAIKARCPAGDILGYYGTSEANGIGMGAIQFRKGCEPEPIVFQTLPESSVAWIRDEERGTPILEPGRPGRLVVTSLYSSEKPFNFAGTFDLAAWEKPGDTFTLCGRAQDQLILPGLFKIDVRNLIERVLDACGGVSGQVVVRDPRSLLVRVDEPERMLKAEELLQCAIAVQPFREPEIREGLLLEMARGTLKTDVGKVNRLIDHRPKDRWDPR